MSRAAILSSGFKKQDLENTLGAVELHLKNMGYDLLPYGAAVALLELESGYNAVETASHIAHTTLALDVQEAGEDVVKLMSFAPHGMALLEVIKNHKDEGNMHPTQWAVDAKAVFHVIQIDENQVEWIEKILSDPIAGQYRLAISRITYE